MAVLRTLPTSRTARATLADDDHVPGLRSLDAVDSAAMLVFALAPTAFVLVSALQMLGVHTL